MRNMAKQMVDVLDEIEKNDKLKEEFKTNKESAVKKAYNVVRSKKQNPLTYDIWLYRTVVFSLGVTLFCTIIGAIIITLIGKGDVPQILIAVGSAAVGALAGLLAPPPKEKEEELVI
jgi:hypothetical protein